MQSQGEFDLNSRLMSGCRIGDGVPQTQDDWPHGLHTLLHVPHGGGQVQVQDFGLTLLPAGNGARRGCELVALGAVAGSESPCLAMGEY